jgi:hypothetical protein
VSLAHTRVFRSLEGGRAIALLAVIVAVLLVVLQPVTPGGAAAGPSIGDPMLATTYGGLLTIHGTNLGGVGAQRSLRFDYGLRSTTLYPNSPPIRAWQDTSIQLELPPQVQSGQLTVIVDGVASNAVDLLVYSYSATSIPPTPGTNPFGLAIAIGPDGTLWLNQEFHQELKSFSPTISPVPSAFLIPQVPGPGIFASMWWNTAARTRTSALGEDITVAPDGKVWFTEGGWSLFLGGTPYFNTSRIVSYDPATSTFACYNAPIDNAEVVGVLIDQRRGMIWYSESGFTDGAAITGFPLDSSLDNCSFDPSRGDARAPICTEEITTLCHKRFPLANPYSFPAHLALDQDGNIWFTEFWADRIGRLSPETGDIVELPIPDPTAEMGPGWMFGSGPWELAFDPNGDLLVSGFAEASILRVQPVLLPSNDCEHLDSNGENPCIDRIFVAPDSTNGKTIHTVSLGVDGLAWFGIEQDSATQPTGHGGQLGFIATEAGYAAVLLPTISGLTSAGGIAQDPVSRDVWFQQPNKIGRLHQLGFGDADGDGVPDSSDNCLLTPNPGQEVTGSNTMGTACDYMACPDFNQDGRITIGDSVVAARHYRQARPDGASFTVIDIMATIRKYGSVCSN